MSARGAPGTRKGFWGHFTSRLPTAEKGSLWARLANAVTALHARIFRATGGRRLASFDGAPLCLLHNRGAKSGQPRQTPLVYLADGERLVFVASNGGNPRHPSWYHNIVAHPDVEIEVGGARRAMRVRAAGEAEADALWPRLLEMWPAWTDYGRKTQRRFPVLICEPR